MIINSLSFSAAFFYLLGATFQWLHLSSKITFSKFKLMAIGLLASLLHSYLLYRWIDTPAGQNLCLSYLFSLVCWLISITILLVAFFKPIENLAAFILPLTALSIPLAIVSPIQDFSPVHYPLSTLIHILISIAAFGLLGLAALQATLLYLQTYLIRNKSKNEMVRLLPPLQTMETLLFQIIGIGFIFLSASLISTLWLENELLVGPRLQKVILSFLAWILFAALLYNRYQSGLRGNKAIHWTLIGVGLLLVAYIGSKLINTGY
jgi:ABC-type uncharacterized transport system permease subunit